MTDPRTEKPLDARDLRERGYSQHEAYGLLRRHGVKIPGGRRLRIAPQILKQIERGEVPA